MTTRNSDERPSWAGHRLVVDATDGPEPVSYHAITSGRIEATDDDDAYAIEGEGAFGPDEPEWVSATFCDELDRLPEVWDVPDPRAWD